MVTAYDSSKQVENIKPFEERMKDRIRESIGELLTDSELKLMIHRSMEEIFFTERVINVGDYYNRREVKRALLHDIVKELMEEKVKDGVNLYIKEHPEVIEKAIESTLIAGVGGALMTAISFKFSNDLHSFTESLRQSLSR